MRKIVKPPGAPVPDPFFSPAVIFGDWVFVSGQLAGDFEHGLASEVIGNPAVPLSGEDIGIRESAYIFNRIEETLEAAGASIQDAVRIDQFPTRRGIMDPYHVERTRRLAQPRPASTSVLVDGLLVPDASIAVELIAIRPRDGLRKEGVATGEIPQPIFSSPPAIRSGDFVFVAAQVATDFVSGVAPEAQLNPNFWQGCPVDRQARYMLRHLQTVLAAAGSSPGNVVKAQVFLTDIRDLPRLDRVWCEFFPNDPPARTVIQAAGVGVAGTCIEINFVAVADEGATRKEVVHTSRAPDPLFHQSQAIRAGKLLFLSGLLAADKDGLAASARVKRGYPYGRSSALAQMEDILRQASIICEAAGGDIADAVRLLMVHTDLHEFAAAAAARRAVFTKGEPATATIKMPAPLLVPGCTMLADMWVGVD